MPPFSDKSPEEHNFSWCRSLPHCSLFIFRALYLWKESGPVGLWENVWNTNCTQISELCVNYSFIFEQELSYRSLVCLWTMGTPLITSQSVMQAQHVWQRSTVYFCVQNSQLKLLSELLVHDYMCTVMIPHTIFVEPFHVLKLLYMKENMQGPFH